MSDSISNCVPYDVTDSAISLNTEYMYRDDGLKLKVIRFEYYKCDDADYNWFILAQIEGSNVIKANRYKVIELYIECPSNAYVQNAINDLYKLKGKLFKLDFNLTYGSGERSELCKMIDQAEVDLQDIIRKLENPDA